MNHISPLPAAAVLSPAVDTTLLELLRENEIFREEIRVARQAAEITANLVVRQFEDFERLLNQFQDANSQRQAVLDAASHMSIITTDLEGTVRLFNKGAENLLGWRAEEMVDHLSLLALHDPGELAERGRELARTTGRPLSGLEILAALAHDSEAGASEWTYVRRDDSHFPVQLSITTLRDSEGEATGYLAVAMDLTERKQAEERAQRYATYLSTVLESLPQGVSVFDANLELVLWNHGFIQVLDLPQAMVHKGMQFHEILEYNARRGEYGPGETTAYIQHRLEQARNLRAFQFERVRPNGHIIEVQSRPMRMDGGVVGFVTTYTDITESRRAEDAVRRANELMEDAIAYSPTYVWEVDRTGVLTFVQGSEKVLGYAPDEMKGRHFTYFRCRETRCRELWAAVDEAMRSFKAFDHRLICAVTRTGGHVWLSMSAHPIYDRKGRYAGYRGVNMDVTELTNAKEELERVALHDTLTGLANRRKFMDAFRMEEGRRERSPRPMSLLVVDIDFFKKVNDRYGHLAGDVCLKCVAAVLEGNTRACDMVARFGGEEFVVMLPETDLEGAYVIAERLRHAMAALDIPVESISQVLKVSVSIGVATMGAEENLSFDDLMKVADDYLYAAKQGGRNQVCGPPLV